MEQANIKSVIENGGAMLGIELGSTRIKAVLIGEDNVPIAAGEHSWENRLENGVWTYHLDDVVSGLQDCYADLRRDVKEKYSTDIHSLKAIGFSAMMHGYLVFDKSGNQLTEFRTWRNTITAEAAEKLTELFNFNIPQRWSIAHLYQAILNCEQHVKDIDFMTTLAGYVHYRLTGERVVGIGEASGMFPIDSAKYDYDENMISAFEKLIADKNYNWNLRDILPKVLNAGEQAGMLTEQGAKLLDVSGNLHAGCPVCPPEGDAGTGMCATNSVRARTGNISAGTSIFSMIVLEKPLKKVYTEIDMVTTPTGKPVAMVHCNNCTTDLDNWVSLFGQAAKLFGADVTKSELYDRLYNAALEGDCDCGGIVSYNFLSGEPVAGLDIGCPMIMRKPDAKLALPNFMRAALFSAMAALKLGNDILADEHVKIDRLTGHGGLFKTKTVGQKLMAAAMKAPVTVMETAGEGGAWGIALLASYMVNRKNGETLEDFLDSRVFNSAKSSCIVPDDRDVKGFDDYMIKYIAGLDAEKYAAKTFN